MEGTFGQIVFFEVNSSTDFQINSNNMQFQPNMFVDISKNLDRKKRALKFCPHFPTFF